MLGRIRSHLSYANVTATIALSLALGGSAYAALEITGKNVENGSLTGVDVRNQSLKGIDVSNLRLRDFKNGRVHTAASTDIVQKDATVAGDGTGTAVAVCPSGKLASGGGFERNSAAAPVQDSFPAGLNAWLVFVEGGTPGTPFSAYAVCSS